jgi:signal transduction histidine kinase/CheY-like chemotaxis protein
MALETLNLAFPQQYLHAALLVSLVSVWLLVGLFYYLNRYTKRDYFTIWTAAWLFYALWLTLCWQGDNLGPPSILFPLKQCCVAICAVFLMWGSLRFLGLLARQTLLGLFMLFLLVWTVVSPQVLSNPLHVQYPVFILLGLGSLFAAVCFYRARKRMPFVGAGMLSLGFFLWGLYLISYPASQQYQDLYSAGFLVAAVLQLFIAVSMIVLVLEEVRYAADQARAEIATVRSENEALQLKVLTTEEQCRTLYDQTRLTMGTQQAYDELRRTQHVVVQQERLRALGQMASGVAHDINNALSPIVAYADLLLDTLPNLTSQARRNLENIRRSGEDIAHIVARLREFYRRRTEDAPLTDVDLNQVVEEVIDLTKPRWKDLSQRDGIDIRIERQLERNLPLLPSDPGDLREALINLVFNAVDALPQGGTITLATRSLNCGEPQAGAEAKPQLQIEVRDNGIGMDEPVRQRCLEPFFSTKAQRGGTGLGLAMVYGMMQRHDGNIDIESTPNQGTCVRLTFPIKANVVRPAPVLPAQNTTPQSLSILCIDDDPHIRELLRDCLTTFSHRVTLAATGQQGLDLFKAALRDNQPFGTVITDLGMPDIDGHRIARAIKADSPTTPVVMLTGWGAGMKENGESAPEVDALIGKPPRIMELNSLLLQLAARESALPCPAK